MEPITLYLDDLDFSPVSNGQNFTILWGMGFPGMGLPPSSALSGSMIGEPQRIIEVTPIKQPNTPPIEQEPVQEQMPVLVPVKQGAPA